MRRTATVVYVVILVGSLLMLGVSALFLTRGISRPVGDAARVVTDLRNGDLSARAEVASEDEIGLMLSGLDQLAKRLNETFGDLHASSESLSSAAEQLASSSQGVSQGTSEQAAAVEETTSSLEEMNASINENAANSRKLEEMALKGVNDAEASGKAVEETVQAMKTIADRISIVEEIAYQTNLLALNAAIEAARAGEHGKGFAVVATEVRKLAERSQAAAREIGEVALTSVDSSKRSGELLAQLVPSIQTTAELVEEVAAASREQAAGVGQINQAMAQVDSVAQRNAAAAEELSSTATELSAQAIQMKQSIAFFRTSSPNDVTGRWDDKIGFETTGVASSTESLISPIGAGRGATEGDLVSGDSDWEEFSEIELGRSGQHLHQGIGTVMAESESTLHAEQYLTFEVSGELLAIGILDLREIITFSESTRVPMAPAAFRGLINLRGSAVPVLDLAMKFGQTPTPLSKRTCVVILDSRAELDRGAIGILADSVSEVIDVSSEEIEVTPDFGSTLAAEFVSGLARVDGRFIPILDVERLLQDEDAEAMRDPGPASSGEEEAAFREEREQISGDRAPVDAMGSEPA